MRNRMIPFVSAFGEGGFIVTVGPSDPFGPAFIPSEIESFKL